MTNPMEAFFWINILALAYAYAGFPLLTWIRALWRKPEPAARPEEPPAISVCIAAYNEEAMISATLDTLLACDYPREKLEILVASDGSSDLTVPIVERYRHLGVILLDLPRGGKNQALNAAAARASNDILVFTDADVLLEKEALRRLTAPFQEGSIGCVAGDFRYLKKGGANANRGEHAYWDFDRLMKKWQTQAGSVTSATGQLYALRKAFHRPLPRGVTDDFVTSVQAVVHGKRIAFAPDAVAWGKGVDSTAKEFKRKIRVMTAGLKGVWEVRELLNPFRHGYYSLQLFSHKVLRRLAALPFLGQSLALALLASTSPWYASAFALQLCFHGAALSAWLLRGTRFGGIKLLALPYYFDMLVAVALVTLCKLALDHKEDKWSPQRSGAETLAGNRIPIETGQTL